MKADPLMEIPESREEAIALQQLLRQRCIWERVIDTNDIALVAGADAAYSESLVYAAAVLVSFPSMEPVAHRVAIEPLAFPYEPGMLAFREGPALLSALIRLPMRPQVIFFNGHGRAHPRRFGLAAHMGVLLHTPSVGIAERTLIGRAEPPADADGATSPLIDGGEVVGMAVRTRSGSRPVIVSQGYMIDLAQAVELTIASAHGERIPLPLRQADRLAGAARREHGFA
ncbi:MAG: endonuclease V [Methanomicrobiales archaeon]|nr:endonuclease V [Methanomicrobiales archaeon]